MIMRIYKVAQMNNFNYIPPNANAPINQDAQLQNLQNSLQAVQFLTNIVQMASNLSSEITDLNDALGTDTGLQQVINQKVAEIIKQTPAYDILSKMGFIVDPTILNDVNKVSQLQVMIQENINQYSTGAARVQG
jgi:hypothetical protein